jgi:hypothetical protein
LGAAVMGLGAAVLGLGAAVRGLASVLAVVASVGVYVHLPLCSNLLGLSTNAASGDIQFCW